MGDTDYLHDNDRVIDSEPDNEPWYSCDLTDWDFPLPLRVGDVGGRVLIYDDEPGNDDPVLEANIHKPYQTQLAAAEMAARSVNLVGPLLMRGWTDKQIQAVLDAAERRKP